MKNLLNEKIEKIRRTHRNYRRYASVFALLALITAAGVAWGLHQNGISMSKTADYSCGQEEHTHSAECYTKVLICGQSENGGSAGHTHTDSCYKTQKKLVCPYTDAEHVHTDACYETEQVLICGQEESAAVAGHTHTDACYESELTCGKEEHTHMTICYSDTAADVETAADWEATLPAAEEMTGVWAEDLLTVAKSQIGYNESTKNYVMSEDGEHKKGYTRYGAWYGNEYGDWCAMFISFCLHYTGITEDVMPRNAGCQAWIVNLSDEGVDLYREAAQYTPETGDIVFFDWDEDGESNHVGIVSELIYDDDENLVKIKTIEGNASDTVKEKEYDITDAQIMGYAELPENPELVEGEKPAYEISDEINTQTSITENYAVSVTYGPEAQIPVDAVLQVTEYGTETEEYQNAIAETGKTYDWLLDISFVREGEEIEPAAALNISVTANKSADEDAGDGVVITHFAEDGTEVIESENVEVADTEDGQTEISFELSSLSLVGGTTYHTATPIVGTNLSSGDNFLIYKVSGSYVYFLANHNNQAKTFRVALSDLPSSGDGTPDLETLSTTTYYNNSITGTIDGAAATLSWSNLLWNYYNGWTVRSVYNSNYYLAVGNSLSLSTTDYRISFSASSDGKHTHISRTNGYNWRLGWENNTFISGRYYTTILGNYGTNYTNVTIAKVSSDYTEPKPVTGGTQTAVYTGEIADLPLGFYSVALKSQEETTDNLMALPGVTYTFYNSDGKIVGSVVTTDEMRVDISALKLGTGTFTMKMTAVPNGYVCDAEEYTFTITSSSKTLDLQDKSSGEHTGIIIVNPESNLTMNKNAAVVNYLERTYNVELTAHTDMKTASIDAISIDFVVDQSNSMLFPSNLEEAKDSSGNALTLDMEKSNDSWYANFDSLNKLSQDQVYYFISDPTGSSTVWALWYNKSVKKWCYQDASYYAKAYYANPNISTYDNTKIKTSDTGISYPTSTYQNFETNAGGSFGTSNNKTAAGGFTRQTSYTIYTASEEYNRLHYLEQSLSDMLQMLAAMNPNIEVTLDTFYAEVNKSCTTTKLTEAGLQTLLSKVGDITTSGGTRQDLALKHSYDNHLTGTGTGHYTNDIKYVIMITDGAIAGSQNNGTATDSTGTGSDTISSSNTAYMHLNYCANLVKQEATLATIGLSMKNVESGKKALQHIATDGIASVNDYDPNVKQGRWWFQPDNSAELASILCEKILNQITHTSEVSDETGTITDYISDTFYPVDQNGNAVESGTQIDINGNVVTSGGVGTIKQAEDGSWYVEWKDQNVGTVTEQQRVQTGTTTSTEWVKGDTTQRGTWRNPVQSYTENGLTYTWQWHDNQQCYWATRTVTTPVYETKDVTSDVTFTGHVYLKAKEDFIGGNAVNTNKSAELVLKSGGTYEYEKPTVNVRLLPLQGNTSQVTVYKGDQINSSASGPQDSIQALYEKETSFQKLVAGTDTVTNKVDQTIPVGNQYFSLKYAIGRDLTEQEWAELKAGKEIQVLYTYNEEDGAVGYFTLKLEKDSVDGQTADWSNTNHTAQVAKGAPKSDGQDTYGSNWIEKYTLDVTYTAYRLGEGRPSENQHNQTGTNNPGNEVGNQAYTTLETGLGTETVNDIHYVYAVDGQIKITKTLADDMVSVDQDQIFTFTVTKDDQIFGRYEVTVEAGEKMATIEPDGLKNLPRGTYTVSETIPDGATYAVSEITVGKDTDCYNTTSEKVSTSFTLGNNTNNVDVVEGGFYAGDGVLGEVTFTNTSTLKEIVLPVEKVWKSAKNDVVKGPADATVYVVLMSKNKDGTKSILTDADGSAQVLALNSGNFWKGSFTVTVSKDSDADLKDSYALGEFAEYSTEKTEGLQTGKLLNASASEASTIYFDAASVVSANDSNIYINKVQYKVAFSDKTTEDKKDGTNASTLVVENISYEYEFPAAGGIGSRKLTAGAVAILGAGLMYGFFLRRRREGREE